MIAIRPDDCACGHVTVLGVGNVGMMTGGPWSGRPCIGCSLAVGPGGEVLGRGRYGVDAEELVVVEVGPRRPVARGTDLIAAVRSRGYEGG